MATAWCDRSPTASCCSATDSASWAPRSCKARWAAAARGARPTRSRLISKRSWSKPPDLDLPLAPRPERLAHFEPHDLAGGEPRQVGGEPDLARPFVVGEALAREREELLRQQLVGLGAGMGLD